MLDLHRTNSVLDPKIYFSHSILPSYIDPQNVSTKKKPFSTFGKQLFSHSLDLLLPEEIYELVQCELDKADGFARSQYARVHMKLGEILESEFLNSYIKQGNILMLSEGRPLVDNRFELYDGTLRMELTRPTYERCGLQGSPIEDGGKKHQNQRWTVEYDLRSPSMKHGKKSFSRLEWACKNVLDQSLTWLFTNLNSSSVESLEEGREPISKHAPWIHKIEPTVEKLDCILVPNILSGAFTGLYGEDESLELLEWLHMLSLKSPRLDKGDSIDPHLSRYEVPDLGQGVAAKTIICVKLRGFITPTFVRDLFIAIKSRGLKSKGRINGTQDVVMEGNSTLDVDAIEKWWFAMSAQGFGGKNAWSVMQFAGRDTLVWEMEH